MFDKKINKLNFFLIKIEMGGYFSYTAVQPETDKYQERAGEQQSDTQSVIQVERVIEVESVATTEERNEITCYETRLSIRVKCSQCDHLFPVCNCHKIPLKRRCSMCLHGCD